MDSLIGRRVLIVDDEPDIRELLADEFRAQGADVWEAAGGEEAYVLFEKNQPDAIVSDLRMPAGSGADLLSLVRSKSRKEPVVVLLSGHSDLSEQDALKLGANKVFQKPCDLTQLVSFVASSLKGSS